VNVSSFHGSAKRFPSVPIATVGTLYEDREGHQMILIIHEALWFGDKHSRTLLNPNHLRANGLTVNDVPRQFDSSSSFSIIDSAQDLEIELSVHGVAAGFTSQKPTVQELESYPHYELTSKIPWDPTDGSLADAESRVVKAAVVQEAAECGFQRNQERLIASVRQYEKAFTSDLNSSGMARDDNADLYDHVIASVTVAAADDVGDGLDSHEDEEVYERGPEVRKIAGLSTDERRSVITPEILSRRFGIGRESAKKTLRVTTQAGIRNVLAPTEQKVRKKLDHLKFPTLSGRIYTDTMIAKRPSIRQHKAVQVFLDGSGFDHFYPIDTKGDAHEALLDHIKEVARRYGVTVGSGWPRSGV
jgi:hypothetical protein